MWCHTGVRAWRVLLGSVAAHGVVFAVIRLEWDTWSPGASETTTPHVELIDITPVPVPPKLDTIDVAFVADTPAAPPSHTRGAPARTINSASPFGAAAPPGSAGLANVAAAGAEMISSGAAASETPGTITDAPKKSLGMRGPELHPADDQ